MERRKNSVAVVALIGTMTLLGACQTPSSTPVEAAPEHPSLALAQAACGECHAVRAQGLSPNPAAPTFGDIANQPGLTRETLSSYLADAHNYPEVMDFDLEPDQAHGLVDYMLTLRSGSYRRPI